MSGYRNYDIKVTGATIRRLSTALELYPDFLIRDVEPSDRPESIGSDGLAEFLINEGIKSRFPDVIALEKASGKFRQEWIASHVKSSIVNEQPKGKQP
jgi:hypothetical protein